MLRLAATKRRQAIKLGSVLVLLLAVMPQVLYLGHPGVRDGSSVQRTGPTGHEHHDEVAAEHANHCHVGPKGCAAADGVVHLASIDVAIRVSENGETATPMDNAPLSRGFALWQRPEKPPRLV